MKNSSNAFMGLEASTPVRRSANRINTNAHTGHANDGRLVNYGRGPTTGNNGECGHSGMKNTAVRPPAKA